MPPLRIEEHFTTIKKKVISLGRWILDHKLKSFFIAGGCLLLIVISFVALIYFGAFGKLPTVSELQKIKNPVTTTIFSGDKKVLGYFFTENRSNMKLEQINEEVKQALVCTEDVRFYNHSGIDYRSLGRVLIKTILMQKGSSGGGSTITQQLAKNVFGRKTNYILSTVVNKIREMFIARRLESIYSKDEILLLYLNTVSFGERIYGLEKASDRFFSKKPEKLDLSQAATLVGLLKATTYYNPKKNPKNSKRRRNVVLSQMLKYGQLDSTSYNSIVATDIKLNYNKNALNKSQRSFFKEKIRSDFIQWADSNPKEDGSLYNIDNDGLSIYTTIHSKIQNYAEEAVANHLPYLQQSFNKNWKAVGGKKKFEKQLIANHPITKRLKKQETHKDSIDKIFRTKGERRVWNTFKYIKGDFSMLDSMLMEKKTLQGSMVAMHAGSGRIMAYVGGRDYAYSQYDHLQIPKQVGSTFKPFVYLSAINKGATPCNFYDNELRSYSSYKDWTPKNSNGEYGGSYSLFGALANSVNTVSVQVLFEAGMKNVIDLVSRLGISTKIKEYPSMVLGTSEIKPIEMVSAYGIIANGGKKIEPYTILKIEDAEGNVIYKRDAEDFDQVIDERSCRSIQNIMTFTNRIGTGKAIKHFNIPYDLIAKTGTTQNNADGWYIASSPEIVCGAWVGTLDPNINFKYTSQGAGSTTALPMVAKVFKGVSSWNTSMISSFPATDTSFFCPAYSSLTAEEANNIPRNIEQTETKIGRFLRSLLKRRRES